MWHADGPVFVGRDAQLAAVRACAADAEAGRARVVWIEGEAGAGKTALLDRALETLPDGFSVLRAEADELAVDLPFGVVGQLADLAATAPFAAGLELLGRWAAEQRPVAVVVEDLHWADVPSRAALATAARRLGRDRVLMIVTSRPENGADGWERLRLDERRCRRIEVGALSVDEVTALAAASGVELAPRAAERLHRHTGGHALYVRTLLAELDPARLTGGEGELPAPRSLASTTVARLAELPTPARELALALAVLGRPVPLVLAGAVAGVADPTAALESLLTTGFVAWRPDPDAEVRFSHPLHRVALLDDLSPTRRRALHHAAAGFLAGGEALAHRVAAADGADAALAAELAAEAERENDRGSHPAAARYLLWAASVEPVRERAERCLLEAVRLLLDDGQLVRAAELRGRVETCASSPRRDLVLGALDLEAGRGEQAEALLRRAAEDGPTEVSAAALSRLGTLYVALGRGRETVEAATRLLGLPGVRPDDERTAWVDAALGEMFVSGAPAGLARLAQRLPQPPDEVPAADVGLLVARGTLGFYAGRATAAVADLRAGVRLARRVGAATALPRAHLQLAQLLVGTGDWDEALLHARLALSLVSEERRVWIQAQAHAVMGRLHACRGDWDRAQEHIAAAESAAAALGTSEAVFTACIARATLARAVVSRGRSSPPSRRCSETVSGPRPRCRWPRRSAGGRRSSSPPRTGATRIRPACRWTACGRRRTRAGWTCARSWPGSRRCWRWAPATPPGRWTVSPGPSSWPGRTCRFSTAPSCTTVSAGCSSGWAGAATASRSCTGPVTCSPGPSPSCAGWTRTWPPRACGRRAVGRAHRWTSPIASATSSPSS